MANQTYASLTQEIIDYMDRTDTTTLDNIPNFISQTEQRLVRELEIVGIETNVVGNMIAGTAVYPKPGRWRRTLSINYGTSTDSNTRVTMFNRSYDTLRAYWPNDTLQDPPLYYADYNYSFFLFAPTPDQNYPYELNYLGLPEQLSINNQTNWFTDYVPDLMLYGSLLEAMLFLKNDERIPVLESYLQRGIISAKNQNYNRLVTRTSDIASDKGKPQ